MKLARSGISGGGFLQRVLHQPYGFLRSADENAVGQPVPRLRRGQQQTRDTAIVGVIRRVVGHPQREHQQPQAGSDPAPWEIPEQLVERGLDLVKRVPARPVQQRPIRLGLALIAIAFQRRRR